MVCLIGLGRPYIRVFTCHIRTDICHIRHRWLTHTWNSLKSQIVMVICPISSHLSLSCPQLYHHLQSVPKCLGNLVHAYPVNNTAFCLWKLATPSRIPLPEWQEMLQEEKKAIIILFYLRYYFTMITLITGWSWSTVSNFVPGATHHLSHENNPCSCRPCIVTFTTTVIDHPSIQERQTNHSSQIGWYVCKSWITIIQWLVLGPEQLQEVDSIETTQDWEETDIPKATIGTWKQGLDTWQVGRSDLK